jgi:hypothetical protein
VFSNQPHTSKDADANGDHEEKVMISKLLTATVLAMTMMVVATVGIGTAQEQPGLGGTATVSGTVTFTDGSPAVNRAVEWRPSGNPNGGSTVQTDGAGGYLIKGLNDGEYFVGYFQPSRLPADKNPNVVDAPDAPTTVPGGQPKVRRVTIKEGQSVSGIDFVITNIGNEQGAGPDTGGAAITSAPALPATGIHVDAMPNSAHRYWLAWASIGASLLGVALLVLEMQRRRSSAR